MEGDLKKPVSNSSNKSLNNNYKLILIIFLKIDANLTTINQQVYK